MKLIYSSQDRILLYLLKAKLDDKNIQSYFKNEQPPLAGEIPPMIAWPQLWILNDNDFDAAKKCIEDELANRTDHKDTWQCPECKEKLEGQFEICWRCGFMRGQQDKK